MRNTRSSCEAEAAFVSGDAMTTSVSAGKPVTRHFEVRRVPLRQPLEWLDRGWTDLKEIRTAGLAHGALIAILGAVLLMLGSTHLYLTAAAVTSYLLVGPVMTTGLCELARRREAKEPVGFDESLRGLTRNPDGLVHFGGALALIAVVWFVLSAVLLQSLLNASVPSLAVALWGGAAEMSAGQLLGYVGCGAILAGMVFAVSVVSVPLIIDRHAGASDAIRASLRATAANLPAMLLWAALIVAMTALGFLTLLVGMVIVAPLLGYATWHAYRDLIG
ncbi:MAG: DUF2189 domain-containing protein [Gammaproteobacteria bacterium]|nr:MAG: DUF2189 domain-containing protein [Gammaproteobacteria bacterium]